MRGGKRPGAGRKRGGLARKTTEIAQEAVARGDLTPLEIMLGAMLHYHEAGDRDRAAAIAKDCAPYVHPRLSAVQVSGGKTPLRLNLVEEIVVSAAAEASTNGEGGGRSTRDHHADGQAAPGAG